MNDKAINRRIARSAARGVHLYGHHMELSDLDARLLAEARDAGKFYCADEEMLHLCRAEYRRVNG